MRRSGHPKASPLVHDWATTMKWFLRPTLLKDFLQKIGFAMMILFELSMRHLIPLSFLEKILIEWVDYLQPCRMVSTKEGCCPLNSLQINPNLLFISGHHSKSWKSFDGRDSFEQVFGKEKSISTNKTQQKIDEKHYLKRKGQGKPIRQWLQARIQTKVAVWRDFSPALRHPFNKVFKFRGTWVIGWLWRAEE